MSSVDAPSAINSVAGDPASRERLRRRRIRQLVFAGLGLAATLVGLATLVALLGDLIADGGRHLDADFFFSFPSRMPERAGIYSAWIGSILVILTTAAISVPMGVLAGLYLEEYAPRNRITAVIEIAVNNLAGVPSIIFGLLALGLFVQVFGLGQSILTGGITLALLILPIVIVATREAVRGVPQDMRQAALALGATKWQSTRDHVLPSALPGVVTGVIIGLSRAIGETAPLILVGGLSFVSFLPVTMPGDRVFEPVGVVDQLGFAVDPRATETVILEEGGTARLPTGQTVTLAPGEPVELPHGAEVEGRASLWQAIASWSPTNWLHQEFTVMPIQMFNWTSRPEQEFQQLAAAAGLVLFTITLLLNGIAIWFRYRLRKRLRW
jgi:phosphate transport system permease protein